jgi:hypothetical protein
VTIALGSDKGRDPVQAILEECRAGNVVAGSATLFERLDEAETAAADWFYVTTKTADRSFTLWDDHPSYAPGAVAGQHVMNHTFVSDEFVQACERSGLRGLSFLRCRSRGRKPVRAWFVALPDQGLGSGPALIVTRHGPEHLPPTLAPAKPRTGSRVPRAIARAVSAARTTRIHALRADAGDCTAVLGAGVP